MRTPEAGELLAGINEWAAIESKSDDIPGVTAMMDRAMADFAAAGLSVEPIAASGGQGPHFRARTPWGGEGKGVLVLCHLDTVHKAGTLEVNPIRTEGDRAYGPGIYDMKGGVFLALTAAQTLIEAGRETPLPIRFLVVSDEEIGSPTSKAHILTEAERAAHVLVTEPAREGGRVVTARKGSARVVLEARGKPAHSGMRHQDGESAVLEMAHQIIAIEAMTNYETGLTLNVGLVSGGSGVNVVPDRCVAEIDMRMTDLAEGEAAIAAIHALRPKNPAVTLTASGGMNRPPYTKGNSVAALFEHARALAAEIGFELGDVATGGGSDGNFTAGLAPTLDGLGVDGAGAHTLEEHLFVSSLVPRMQLLRRLFETLE